MKIASITGGAAGGGGGGGFPIRAPGEFHGAAHTRGGSKRFFSGEKSPLSTIFAPTLASHSAFLWYRTFKVLWGKESGTGASPSVLEEYL